MFKREPSAINIQEKEYRIGKVFYNIKDNLLHTIGKNSSFSIDVTVPYNDLLKTNDFLTYLIYEEDIFELGNENSKIVRLNPAEIEKIINITLLNKAENIIIKNGIIEISNWEEHPSITGKFIGINDKEIEIYLNPIMNTDVDFHCTDIQYALESQLKSEETLVNKVKNMDELSIVDFYKHPVWQFNSEAESLNSFNETAVSPYHKKAPFEPRDSIVLGSIFLDNESIEVLCFISNIKFSILEHIEAIEKDHDEKVKKFLIHLRKGEKRNINLLNNNYQVYLANNIIYIDNNKEKI